MSDSPQETTPTARFNQGVFFTGAGTSFNVAFIFLETVVAVRLLDTESYGLFVLLVAVVNFLVMASDFGIATAIVKLVASSDGQRQSSLANSIVLFRLAVVAGVALMIWLAQPIFGLVDTLAGLPDYAIYIPMMLLFTSFDELLFNMLQGFRIYRQVAIAQSLRGVLRLALTLLFLVALKAGVVGLIYSWTISFAASALYAWWALPVKKYWTWQPALLKETLGFGAPLTITRFLWFAFNHLHVLLLGALAGPASVALYSVATRIPTVLERFSQAYISVFFPTMSALLAEGKREQANRVLDRSLRLVSFATALLAVVVAVFNQEIVNLIFSERYAAVGSALALLMMAFQMIFIISILGYTLTAAGYPGLALRESAARTMLTMLGDIILIPLMGFIGPVVAVLFGGYATNPLMVAFLRRSGIPVNVKSYAKQIVTLIACVLLFALLQPAHIIYKLSIIALFVALSVSFSTVSARDFSLVLPEGLARQLTTLEAQLSQKFVARVNALFRRSP